MQIVPRKKQPFGDAQGRQSGDAMSLRDAMNQMFDESFWNPYSPGEDAQ